MKLIQTHSSIWKLLNAMTVAACFQMIALFAAWLPNAYADRVELPPNVTGSSPEECVAITDCDGDGWDDNFPELTPVHCTNPEHVCIDDGTCRPKADGYCRIDDECEMPKICDGNFCKLPGSGLEDGAPPDPFQSAIDAIDGTSGVGPAQGSCPYGFYKNNSNECFFGCATDADCGFRSLPNDRRCRLIPNHSACVAHLHLCATSAECRLKCEAVYSSESEGNILSTIYEWKGQGGRQVRCIPIDAPPACTATNEGATIEGLITRY